MKRPLPSAIRIGALFASLLVLALATRIGFPASAPNNGLRLEDLSQNESAPAVFKRTPTSVADLKAMEKHVEELVARVSPAVVAVQVNWGAGSGVVVSSDGLVLSAAHVCQNPGNSVRFTFPDGKVAHGKTLGTNHELDCGLMQITDAGPWPFVEMGDRASVQPGDWVLALGHPGGFLPERPVVARLGRLLRSGMLLQTDCTLVGGDSGGPLFDMSGRVIGIHSRISEATTENFHIPIANYADNWTRLAQGDDWGQEQIQIPASIGISPSDGPDGCRIERVIEGGPADRAGLRPGDVVMRAQGQTIEDSRSLTRIIHEASPGDKIVLHIRRDGVEMSLRVETEAPHWRSPRQRGP